MREPVMVSVDDSVAAAAALMREHDIGSLPVMNGTRIVGMITDRDIAIRHLAATASDGAMVQNIMAGEPVTCPDTASVEHAAALMGDNQVRRLPVLDRAGRLVGIVSVDDIAENYSEHLAGETLGEIVEYR